MWRIALNTARSRLRTRRVRHAVDGLWGGSRALEATIASGEGGFDAEVVDALRTLSARESAVLILRHVYGYTSDEIADRVGVDVRSIPRISARAAERMRSQLGDYTEEATS